MGSRTGIAWTDVTWNPVRGCSKVSEGCRFCYAEVIAARFCGEPESPFYTFARQSPARWTGEVALVPEKLAEPLRWRRPRRVFVNSMSDLFHEKLADRDIAAVFGVIAACPRLTFQVLTKRPERMRQWFASAPWGGVAPGGPADECVISAGVRMGLGEFRVPPVAWPLPNVWLGVSVEDQATADARIQVLLDTPAALRFVSYEPALGAVDLGDKFGRYREIGSGLLPCPDWVIVGGESGPKARPFDVAWARSVVRQCREAGVPCFVKQLGARPMMRADSTEGRRIGDHPEREWPVGTLFGTSPDQMGTEWQGRWAHAGAPYEGGRCVGRPVPFDRAGADPEEWPEDLRVREFPEVRRG